MRMQILEAYCVDSGKTLNIYEAQSAYFSQPDGKRKKFEFRCSDKACRDDLNPLVSGINYHRLAEDGEKFRQMHFRANADHPHIATCKWKLAVEDDAVKPADEDESSTSRTARAKETNVIDAFSPRAFDQDERKQDKGPARKPSDTPDKSSDDDRVQKPEAERAGEGQSRTSLLERFIDCWSQFEGDELREHYVNIEGQRLSYRHAVVHIQWLKPEENRKRITTGGARVKHWPAKNPTHVYINFFDGCENFADNQGNKSLSIELPLSRINRYRSAPLLLAKLEQAQKPNHYLKIFAWGNIKERASKPGYLLEIDALDNLVLKVIRKPGAAQIADND